MAYYYTCSLFLTIFRSAAMYYLLKSDINNDIDNMCTVILYSYFIKHAHTILMFKLCMYSISDFWNF